MKTIYKYPLGNAPAVGSFTLDMQEGAEILTVQVQDGKACVWAIVDPKAAVVARTLAIVGTGRPMPEGDAVYINTFQLFDVELVWHLFDFGEAP